jgi:hypothetical protein
LLLLLLLLFCRSTHTLRVDVCVCVCVCVCEPIRVFFQEEIHPMCVKPSAMCVCVCEPIRVFFQEEIRALCVKPSAMCVCVCVCEPIRVFFREEIHPLCVNLSAMCVCVCVCVCVFAKGLVDAHTAVGQWSEAIHLASKFVESTGGSSEAMFLVGRVYVALSCCVCLLSLPFLGLARVPVCHVCVQTHPLYV